MSCPTKLQRVLLCSCSLLGAFCLCCATPVVALRPMKIPAYIRGIRFPLVTPVVAAKHTWQEALVHHWQPHAVSRIQGRTAESRPLLLCVGWQSNVHEWPKTAVSPEHDTWTMLCKACETMQQWIYRSSAHKRVCCLPQSCCITGSGGKVLVLRSCPWVSYSLLCPVDSPNHLR